MRRDGKNDDTAAASPLRHARIRESREFADAAPSFRHEPNENFVERRSLPESGLRYFPQAELSAPNCRGGIGRCRRRRYPPVCAYLGAEANTRLNIHGFRLWFAANRALLVCGCCVVGPSVLPAQSSRYRPLAQGALAGRDTLISSTPNSTRPGRGGAAAIPQVTEGVLT